ncbi:helix-turn-helix transcriptional regulator [Halomonas sp. BMC6]|uniref:helix-turn-helix domain-containing protein n=1 Tax=Halomonas sp. BMC6 TaxID=3073244 RepID=UPI0030D49E3E
MAEIKKVTDLIIERQLDLDLTNQDIAGRVGYANANVISMIKKGRTKLPLDKVKKMADALNVDRARLMRMALSEYMGDAYLDIVEVLGEPTTQNERVLLQVWRSSTNHEDPALTEAEIKGLHQGFQTIMNQSAASM